MNNLLIGRNGRGDRRKEELEKGIIGARNGFWSNVLQRIRGVEQNKETEFIHEADISDKIVLKEEKEVAQNKFYQKLEQNQSTIRTFKICERPFYTLLKQLNFDVSDLLMSNPKAEDIQQIFQMSSMSPFANIFPLSIFKTVEERQVMYGICTTPPFLILKNGGIKLTFNSHEHLAIFLLHCNYSSQIVFAEDIIKKTLKQKQNLVKGFLTPDMREIQRELIEMSDYLLSLPVYKNSENVSAHQKVSGPSTPMYRKLVNFLIFQSKSKTIEYNKI